MKYKDLKDAYRIEYKFIQDDQLKYAQSQPLTLKELHVKMTELKEDESVQSFIVVKVKYFDKL